MKKQMMMAVNALVIAAFLAMMMACQKPAGADNKNTGNANSTVSNSNAGSANSASGANSNVAKPDSTSNVNAAEKSSSEDSASDKKSDEKLEQRIIGLWEGKSPAGEKIGLDFRADNKVYPVGGGAKEEKPAQYKVIDEETVELTTPDAKPETWTIKVNGDKMIVNADTAKLEFTKAK